MKLDDELARALWDAIQSRVPDQSVFAMALLKGDQALVISNIPDDEDVQSFLRVMADQHARDKPKPNSSACGNRE